MASAHHHIDQTFGDLFSGDLPEAGPWGTGPFKLVEGNLRFGKGTERVVLEAYNVLGVGPGYLSYQKFA
jgi:hypothetical protein